MALHSSRAASARYSNVSMFLHGSIATLIAAYIALVWLSGANHKLVYGVAVAILLLSFARLCWRLMQPVLPLPTVMLGWEKGVARAAHAAFYLAMIAIPLWTVLHGTAASDTPAMLALFAMHIGGGLKHAYMRRHQPPERTSSRQARPRGGVQETLAR